MVKIVWTELAIEDLRSIHEYISKGLKTVGRQTYRQINIEGRTARTQSKAGRVVPEFNIETIRELIEGNYRIIYNMNQDLIAIVRVHHSARQLKHV